MLFSGFVSTAAAKDNLYFVVMASKDPVKEGVKYKALSNYIAAQIPEIGQINVKTAKDYAHAVQLFQSGKVDGMFAGSFVAAVFIKKGLAEPVVRPVNTQGVSTYKALVVAKEGTATFDGLTDFEGKKVAYCSLASSGQVFAKTLLDVGEQSSDHYTEVIVKSHQEAFDKVAGGEADFAVGKNLVWDPDANPGLTVIGGDSAENPNNTLILASKTAATHGESLAKVLLGLEGDSSAKAMKLKEVFKVRGFIETTSEDFSHTFTNLEKAHVDADTFDFAF